MKALQILNKVLDEQEQHVLRIVIDGGIDNPETYISRVEVYNRTTMGSTQVDGILDRLGAAGLIEAMGGMVRADRGLIDERLAETSPKLREKMLLDELFGFDSYFADAFRGQLESMKDSIDKDYPLTFGSGDESGLRDKVMELEDRIRRIGETMLEKYIDDPDDTVRRVCIESMGKKGFALGLLERGEEFCEEDRKMMGGLIKGEEE